MIRKINYGGCQHEPAVMTISFTNEYISGKSLLDLKDINKMNDKKPILEFMKSLNRKKSISVRRHSV